MEIRRLDQRDHDALVTLRAPGFGGSGALPGGKVEHPAYERWGLFLGGGLVATASRKPYAAWFGGERVPTAGIAGVVIAPEFRGRGLLRPLMERVIDDARSRGDRISTLFATAPGIYRNLGYRTVGALDTIEVPTSALHRFRRRHELRRATTDDLSAVIGIYTRWASARNGPLTRESIEFDEAAWISDLTGVTLALDGGEPVAYAGWNRSSGIGEGAFVEAEDMVWADESALESLLWMFGTFSTVAPTVRFDTSGDELTSVLPQFTVREHRPYDLLALDPRFEVPDGPVLIRDYF